MSLSLKMRSLRYQNLSGLERRRYGTRERLRHKFSSYNRPLLHFVVSATSSSNSNPSPSTSTSPTKRDYSVSLFDALKFNGPAPELINGRLAMLGLVAGVWQEAHSGVTLIQQAAKLPVSDMLGLAMWVYASLVPILKGAKMEAFGWFTPRAEITNGRAAMLGIAALLLLEYKAGMPCFSERCISDGVSDVGTWVKGVMGTDVSWESLPTLDFSKLDLSTLSKLDLSALPTLDLSTLPKLDLLNLPQTLSTLDLSTLSTLTTRALDLVAQ